MSRPKDSKHERQPMTFEFLCDELRATPAERQELWEFLAFLRVKAMLGVMR